jgi:SAM-dependent methyltransferase
MAIDYDEAARTYDNTRAQSPDLIELFDRKIHFASTTRILDFGCGTGNYLNAIQRRYGSQCFGVEPSDGMIEKAMEKNSDLVITKGDHASIPFQDGFFDFIFMTDVIHHVPDLELLFRVLSSKLKRTGVICILTESHAQIESRWYNAYFPSLEGNEKKRYPDIDTIVKCAALSGLSHYELQNKKGGDKEIVSAVFIRMVEEKNYSMFRLLDQTEYAVGLGKLKSDLGKEVNTNAHGETLLWLAR